MKPEMLSAASDIDIAVDGSPKIHVLEPGKENWDVIRGVAHSGVQEEAFYVLDVGDIIRKHKEWKLKMPRVSPFYGILSSTTFCFQNKVAHPNHFVCFLQLSSATTTAPCWRRWPRWEPPSIAPPR